jgi:hypothetical protein
MTNLMRSDNTFNKYLEQDKEELLAYLKEINLYSDEKQNEIKEDLIEVHKNIYSLCLWITEFDGCPINQKIYLEQIRSDAIQSLYLSLLGFKKPVKLLLRGMIEDILNHVYYYDHKIEYERLETEASYYQDLGILWDYIKKHPRMKIILDQTEVYSMLKQYYSELSKFVHSSTTKHMDKINTIDDVNYDVEFYKEYKKEINNIACCINFILFVFYKVNVEYKSELYTHILRFMPENHKKALASI